MSDREMLEMAAKAAGFAWVDGHVSTGLRDRDGRVWNPLTDDGDAFRLAVKLDMEVRNFCGGGWTVVVFGYSAPMTAREDHGDDPYAATRRAIVRAAAELGRNDE